VGLYATVSEHQQEKTIVGERADLTFDPDVLRAKYAQERERRLRPSELLHRKCCAVELYVNSPTIPH
jgi:hypothetical protein